VPERRAISFEEMIAGTEAVIETVNGSSDGRIRVFVTPFTIVPSVDPSNPSTPDKAVVLTADDRMQARRVRETARKWGLRIHSDAFAGQVRMAFQDKENGLLGPDVHLQHCIGLSHEEVDILAGTGTHMTHSPGGRAPILDMISKGVNVAITSDGTSPKRPFDLFQMARMAQFAQHMLHNDQYLLPPGKLLEMITVDAARALGLESEIGSLEAGKKADIAILNLRQPHLTPNWMVVHRLIHQAVGGDVDTVIVDGKVLMEDRRVLSVDMVGALDLGEREARALVKRAGLEPHMHDPGWGRLMRTFEAPVVPPSPPAVE
jgi:cytosine/adenosine deaminase-related metal-dependent hydrolase